MLSLGIKPGDYIVIGDSIVIQALEFDNQVRLKIEAPREVSIQRAALYEKDHPVPACILKERRK